MSGLAWRSDKVRRDRAAVEPWVNLITSRLGGGFELHFCGSWRRGRPMIGDLDVLVVSDDGLLSADIGAALPEVNVERGEWVGGLVHGSIAGDGDLHVDFYSCTPEQRGPFLWHLTGPADLNIAMRSRAIARGLGLNQYGLWRGEQRIDDGSERSVAKHLSCKYLLDPTAREAWQQAHTRSAAAVVARTVQSSSDATRTYTVTEVDGVPESCTCPGFKYRGKCRHTNYERSTTTTNGAT
jgi:hypothetical protein